MTIFTNASPAMYGGTKCTKVFSSPQPSINGLVHFNIVFCCFLWSRDSRRLKQQHFVRFVYSDNVLRVTCQSSGFFVLWVVFFSFVDR